MKHYNVHVNYAVLCFVALFAYPSNKTEMLQEVPLFSPPLSPLHSEDPFHRQLNLLQFQYFVLIGYSSWPVQCTPCKVR